MTSPSTSKKNDPAAHHQANAAPAKRPAAGLRRRLVIYGALFALLLVWPAWRQIQATSLLSRSARSLAADDLPAALAELHRLDRQQPGRADVQYRLGVAYRRLGVLDQALVRLRRAQRLGWPTADVQRQRLLANFQAGAIEENRAAIENLLQQNLDDEATQEVYEALAKGYLAAFRVVEARTLLEFWLQWRPSAIQPQIWLAQLLENQLDYPGAEERFRSVLQIEPLHRQARLGLARVLIEQNRVTPAGEVLEQMHRELPDDLEIMLELARCRRNAGEQDAAQELLDRALAAELPAQWRAAALVESGQIALANRKIPQAIEHLQTAVRLAPDHQQAHHALGTALAASGKTAEARIHLDRSAEMLERHGRIRELAHELARKPDSADLQFEVGRTLMDLGLRHEALRWMLLATAGTQPPPGAHAALADLYADLGNQPLAEHHRVLAARTATDSEGASRHSPSPRSPEKP